MHKSDEQLAYEYEQLLNHLYPNTYRKRMDNIKWFVYTGCIIIHTLGMIYCLLLVS